MSNRKQDRRARDDDGTLSLSTKRARTENDREYEGRTLSDPPLRQRVQQDGILLHVLSYFEVSEVVRSKRVSKKWQGLCNQAIEDNFQPKKEFEKDGYELRVTAKKYCRYEVDSMNEIGRTYGFPINKWPVGKVRDFSHLFAGQENFDEDINKWDMSRAERFDAMFKGATKFNKPLDRWKTGKVKNMMFMFCDTEAFDQPLATWDTSRVEDISYMFSNAQAFNQNIESWNTSNVRCMMHVFDGAQAFNQSLALWDTASVTDIVSMFRNAKSFNQCLASWNTEKVNFMCRVFKGATSFNQSLASWDCSGLVRPDAYKGILCGATSFQETYPSSWTHELAFSNQY